MPKRVRFATATGRATRQGVQTRCVEKQQSRANRQRKFARKRGRAEGRRKRRAGKLALVEACGMRYKREARGFPTLPFRIPRSPSVRRGAVLAPHPLGISTTSLAYQDAPAPVIQR